MTAATVAAGLAVAGCAPVKMGAAAIVGNNSVSIAQLDTEAGQLAAGTQKYPSSSGSLTQQQITQATLSWLIRFQIADQVASQNGLTVTSTQMQQAFQNVCEESVSQTAQSAQAAKECSPPSALIINQIMVGAGLAPNLKPELGRWLAIEDDYIRSQNGGAEPTSQTSATTLQAKYTHASCEAAKLLNIRVNPQFGRMSYAQAPYSVVAAADTVSRPSGKVPNSSPGGLTPAC